jgi:hypothetical protein
MNEPIYKVDRIEQTDSLNVNLTDLNLEELEKGMTREPTILAEANRGVIAKTAVQMVFVVMVILPLTGGLVAALGSAEQAARYTTTVVALLDAVGRFSMIVTWPVMAYYFFRFTTRK